MPWLLGQTRRLLSAPSQSEFPQNRHLVPTGGVVRVIVDHGQDDAKRQLQLVLPLRTRRLTLMCLPCTGVLSSEYSGVPELPPNFSMKACRVSQLLKDKRVIVEKKSFCCGTVVGSWVSTLMYLGISWAVWSATKPRNFRKLRIQEHCASIQPTM